MISSSEDKLDAPKYKGKKGQKREFKKPKKISERYLYNSGLAYLQRFPASSMHFTSVMMRKIQKSCRHHTEQDIEQCKKWLEQLVIKFQELGLLDDKAYLKGMITSLRRRGLSSLQIEMKLKQKGYERDTIHRELKNHDICEYDNDGNGDLYAAITFARKKKLGPYDHLKKHSFEKSLAAMARAGYSYDIAKKILELSDDDLHERSMRL
ncbi:MAG: regulatory protein RecX [Alphaproteobacteria bacterium]|nr:regulatory protein RecX [Alphaproteobacteria bacterium]